MRYRVRVKSLGLGFGNWGFMGSIGLNGSVSSAVPCMFTHS